MLILVVVPAAVNVFDIVIHVGADQLEPLRIAGNVIVLLAALALFAVPRLRRAWVEIAAGTGNLVLNGVFIAREAIGTLGWILVGTTNVLCVALAALPRRRSEALH